jgi:hypothetical protein
MYYNDVFVSNEAEFDNFITNNPTEHRHFWFNDTVLG